MKSILTFQSFLDVPTAKLCRLMPEQLTLRALEKTDLEFIHKLNNNRNIMTYWFEEPYESFDELEDLYEKHIHDNTERRFIAEGSDGNSVGLVELLEIDYIHRTSEFAIIVSPDYQGKGLARSLISQALDYAFSILNLNKVYLLVAVENEKAIHLYDQSGFTEEGRLIQEVFTGGKYRDVIRMYILQETFFRAQ